MTARLDQQRWTARGKLARTAALPVDVQQHVRHAVAGVSEDAAAVERQVALAGDFHSVNGCALDADDQADQAVRDLLRVVHHLHVDCSGDTSEQHAGRTCAHPRDAPALPPD